MQKLLQTEMGYKTFKVERFWEPQDSYNRFDSRFIVRAASIEDAMIHVGVENPVFDTVTIRVNGSLSKPASSRIVARGEGYAHQGDYRFVVTEAEGGDYVTPLQERIHRLASRNYQDLSRTRFDAPMYVLFLMHFHHRNPDFSRFEMMSYQEMREESHYDNILKRRREEERREASRYRQRCGYEPRGVK
jgi:hypothetical protein